LGARTPHPDDDNCSCNQFKEIKIVKKKIVFKIKRTKTWKKKFRNRTKLHLSLFF
jgi:hypothetical protein